MNPYLELAVTIDLIADWYEWLRKTVEPPTDDDKQAIERSIHTLLLVVHKP